MATRFSLDEDRAYDIYLSGLNLNANVTSTASTNDEVGPAASPEFSLSLNQTLEETSFNTAVDVSSLVADIRVTTPTTPDTPTILYSQFWENAEWQQSLECFIEVSGNDQLSVGPAASPEFSLSLKQTLEETPFNTAVDVSSLVLDTRVTTPTTPDTPTILFSQFWENAEWQQSLECSIEVSDNDQLPVGPAVSPEFSLPLKQTLEETPLNTAVDVSSLVPDTRVTTPTTPDTPTILFSQFWENAEWQQSLESSIELSDNDQVSVSPAAAPEFSLSLNQTLEETPFNTTVDVSSLVPDSRVTTPTTPDTPTILFSQFWENAEWQQSLESSIEVSGNDQLSLETQQNETPRTPKTLGIPIILPSHRLQRLRHHFAAHKKGYEGDYLKRMIK